MLHSRVLARFCLALSCGIAAGLLCTFMSLPVTVAFCAAVAVGCALFCIFSSYKALPAVFTAGFFYAFIFYSLAVAPCSAYIGQEVTFECYTIEASADGITVASRSVFPAGTRLMLSTDGELPIENADFGVAEEYRITAVISEVGERYMYADGIRLTGTITDISTGEKQAPVTVRVLSKIRDYFCRLFDGAIGSQRESSVAKAMTLGRRESLGRDISASFRSAGLYHMLALSGIHFSVVTGIVWLIVRSTRMKQATMSAVTVSFIILYLILVGSTPSVVRAAVAACVFAVAYAVKRTHDTLTSLSLAMAFLLVLQPYTVFSLSFSLSFLGTLGVLFAGTRTIDLESSHTNSTRGGRALVSVTKAVTVTFYASAFTLPVSVMTFGEATLLTPLSNIVASLPCTLALESNMLLLAGGTLLPFLRPVFGFVSRMCNAVLLYIVDFLAGTGLFSVSAQGVLPYVAAAALAASEVFLVLAYKEESKKASRTVFTIALLALVGTIVLQSLKA